jgi:hypothetical protein
MAPMDPLNDPEKSAVWRRILVAVEEMQRSRRHYEPLN